MVLSSEHICHREQSLFQFVDLEDNFCASLRRKRDLARPCGYVYLFLWDSEYFHTEIERKIVNPLRFSNCFQAMTSQRWQKRCNKMF